MNDLIEFIWPFFIIIVVFFFVAKIWMALVDTAASGAKKALGIKPKKINWHTLDSQQDVEDGPQEKEKGGQK